MPRSEENETLLFSDVPATEFGGHPICRTPGAGQLACVDSDADQLSRLIDGLRLPLDDEKRLQSELGTALSKAGFQFEAEHDLGTAGRLDFFLASGLAVECKLRSSRRRIFRRLQRYALHPDVQGIFLVTNTSMGLPGMIEGKPAYYCSLGSAWL